PTGVASVTGAGWPDQGSKGRRPSRPGGHGVIRPPGARGAVSEQTQGDFLRTQLRVSAIVAGCAMRSIRRFLALCVFAAAAHAQDAAGPSFNIDVRAPRDLKQLLERNM